MVKYVRDTRHGFGERPHYEPGELDRTFERLAVKFLSDKYGKPAFPFQTEDLKTFIEEHVDSLDQYADLSRYGAGVEGVTEFEPGRKPKVLISNALEAVENRLRSTLAHEFGHVHLHAYLFEMRARQSPELASDRKPGAIYCKPDTIVTASKVDWLEWQASYASSALLVPATFLRATIAPIREKHRLYGPTPEDSAPARDMIDAVTRTFQVSRDAARVRLSVLGYLGRATAMRSLFD